MCGALCWPVCPPQPSCSDDHMPVTRGDMLCIHRANVTSDVLERPYTVGGGGVPSPGPPPPLGPAMRDMGCGMPPMTPATNGSPYRRVKSNPLGERNCMGL